MTLVVEITQAALMPDLISGLERSGCAADRVGPAVARVRDLGNGTSEEEARLELAFFVRAWQLGHPGVEVTISE
jgi:hypothetical protein